MPEEKPKEEENPKPQTGEEEKPQDENPEPEQPEVPEEPKEAPEEDSEPIDHKAELEQLEKTKIELEKAKKKIGHLEREKEQATDTEEIDELRTEISELKETISSIKTDALKPQAEIVADQLASTEDERKHIMFHYENSIKLTGNTLQDVKNAQVLANRKVLEGRLSEAQRALRKPAAGSGQGAGRKQPAGKPIPKLSEGDQKMWTSLVGKGWKWDAQKGALMPPKGRTLAKPWYPGQALAQAPSE